MPKTFGLKKPKTVYLDLPTLTLLQDYCRESGVGMSTLIGWICEDWVEGRESPRLARVRQIRDGGKELAQLAPLGEDLRLDIEE